MRIQRLVFSSSFPRPFASDPCHLWRNQSPTRVLCNRAAEPSVSMYAAALPTWQGITDFRFTLSWDLVSLRCLVELRVQLAAQEAARSREFHPRAFNLKHRFRFADIVLPGTPSVLFSNCQHLAPAKNLQVTVRRMLPVARKKNCKAAHLLQSASCSAQPQL